MKIKLFLTWFCSGLVRIFFANFFPTVEFKFHSSLMSQLKASRCTAFSQSGSLLVHHFLRSWSACSLITFHFTFTPVDLHGPLHPGLHHELQGKLSFSAWSTSSLSLFTWCVHDCSSHMISLFSKHNYICPITFFFPS